MTRKKVGRTRERVIAHAQGSHDWELGRSDGTGAIGEVVRLDALAFQGRGYKRTRRRVSIVRVYHELDVGGDLLPAKINANNKVTYPTVTAPSSQLTCVPHSNRTVFRMLFARSQSTAASGHRLSRGLLSLHPSGRVSRR